MSLGLLSLGAWSCGPPSPAPSVVEPAAPELLDPAVRELVDGALAGARERPRSADAHGRLGMIYEANALWPEAREAYRRAADLDPDRRAWRFHLAIATEQAGDFDAALADYRRLAAEHPDFAALHQRLGLALLALGEIDAAFDAFRRVTELRPREAAGYLGAGTAERLRGRPEAAAERLERALAIDPHNRSAHYQLGLALQTLDRPEAERHLGLGLSASVDHLPDELSAEIDGYAVSLPATVARAEALRRAGRHQEAAALFERALVHHPDHATLLNNLAAAQLAQGAAESARATLERALTIHGDDPETLLNLAGWALAVERPREALHYADRALELDRRLARLHGVRAQALIGLRRYAEATTSMEEALRLEVRDPALYLGLGVLYEAAARWPAARALYERALSSWPDLVPAHVGRCQAALALGDRPAAEAALADLRRLAPDHPRLPELERALADR